MGFEGCWCCWKREGLLEAADQARSRTGALEKPMGAGSRGKSNSEHEVKTRARRMAVESVGEGVSVIRAQCDICTLNSKCWTTCLGGRVGSSIRLVLVCWMPGGRIGLTGAMVRPPSTPPLGSFRVPNGTPSFFRRGFCHPEAKPTARARDAGRHMAGLGWDLH